MLKQKRNIRFLFNVRKALWKLFSFFLGFIFLVTIAVLAYLYYNRDKVSEKILLSANQYTNGELSFDRVSISPFSQFPKFSVALFNVSFKSATSDSISSDSILTMERIDVALDIIDLLNQHLNITGISIKNGSLNIVRHCDSTLNIINALRRPLKTDITKRRKIKLKPPGELDLQISLDEIVIENVEINFSDSVLNQKTHLSINQLTTSFHKKQEKINCVLKTDINLVRLPIPGFVTLENREFITQVDFEINMSDSLVVINSSIIELDKAMFNADGIINYGDSKNLNLQFSAYDDLSITNLILTKKGFKKIQGGEILFEGTVQSNFDKNIPSVNCRFGVNNLSLKIPDSKHYIKDVNMKGQFSSGKSNNFSDASLSIDTLYATIPNGRVNAYFKIKNFVLPEVETAFDIDMNLDHFDELFKLDFIEDIKGRIAMKYGYRGIKSAETGWTFPKNDSVFILFDNLSVLLKDRPIIESVNGSLRGIADSIFIDGLKFVTGNSDLTINGDLLNLGSLFFDNEQLTEANLVVNSETFDLPEFIRFFPQARQDLDERFPYKYKDITIKTKVTITKEALENYIRTPAIFIDIPYLNVRIDCLLPPVTLTNGYFKITEIDSTLIYDIKDFDIKFHKGTIHGGCTLYKNPGFKDSISINASLLSVNPQYLLNYYKDDTLTKHSDSEIKAEVFCKMKFSRLDTIRAYENIYMEVENIYFQTLKDTIQCRDLIFKADDVIIEKNPGRKLLARLSLQSDIKINHLFSSDFYIYDLHTITNVDKGVFHINTLTNNSLLFNSKGIIELAPFERPAYFNIDYKIDSLKFETLFSHLNQDPIVFGDISFHFNLNGAGVKWKEIAPNINGTVNMKGEDLLMRGVDLDNLIRKLNRAQNFHLADVGAVLLAGPAGVAFTKGTDFLSLLANNPDDTTIIPQIISEWDIQDGKIAMKDVAFSTAKNRVAVQGEYNLSSDSLYVIIAIIDKKGKSVIQQSVTGTWKNPEMSKIKPVKALLAPVTNLGRRIFGIRGKPFYEGKVQHPSD